MDAEHPLSIEQRLLILEGQRAAIQAALALLAPRRDLRRLPVRAAAKEFGISLKDFAPLLATNGGPIPVCTATTNPRVPMEDADRVLRERFTLLVKRREAA